MMAFTSDYWAAEVLHFDFWFRAIAPAERRLTPMRSIADRGTQNSLLDAHWRCPAGNGRLISSRKFAPASETA